MTLHADGLLTEGIGAVGSFAHILEPKQVALGRFADNQLIEIRNRNQVAVVLHQDRIGKLLITTRRRATHQAANRHRVLIFYRRHNLVSSELVGRQLGRIHEKPEGRIATTEQVDAGHARNPTQLIIEIFVNQAIKIGRVELALGGRDLIGQQNRRGALHHRDTRGLHLLGQLGHGQRNPVLHIDLVNVDVGVFVEVDLDRALALAGTK